MAYHIRSGAIGDNSGSDWTNAFPTWPASFIRDEDYYIAAGSYGNVTVNQAASGTDRIRVKRATYTEHGSAIGWNPDYADGVANFTRINFNASYVLFTGQHRSGWKTGYPIKITTGQPKAIERGTGVHTLEIAYTEAEGVGRDGVGSPSNDIVYFLSGSDYYFHHCYFHHPGRTVFLLRACTDSLVEYCWFARNESTPEQHSQAVSAMTGTDGWVFRFNYWEDIEGTAIITFFGDAWQVYGNVFFNSGEDPEYPGGTGNGSVATWTGYVVSNTAVHHNTFVDLLGWNSGVQFFSLSEGQGNTSYNNLYINCQAVGLGGHEHDYNAFWDSNARGEPNAQINVPTNIFRNYGAHDFSLAYSTTPGVSLGSPYNVDIIGTVREPGRYDRGAYQLVRSFGKVKYVFGRSKLGG